MIPIVRAATSLYVGEHVENGPLAGSVFEMYLHRLAVENKLEIHMSEYVMNKCGFKDKSQSDLLNRVLARKHVSVPSVACKTTGLFTT